jgi:hypothetical protein
MPPLMRDPHWLSIDEIGACLRQGDIGVVELTQVMLDRIAALDGSLNSFITVTDELALAQAETAQRELSAGHDRGPLHGIPVAVKDLLATKGIRTTFASRAYADDIPDFNATVVAKLAAAGAVLLGKTNLSEGAADSSSQSSAFGGPNNPWNRDYITGGGGRRPGLRRHRQRHRHVDPPARRPVRHCRVETNVWPGFKTWRHGVVRQLGPFGSHDTQRGGRGLGLGGHIGS